jgi:hypothetical protein
MFVAAIAQELRGSQKKESRPTRDEWLTETGYDAGVGSDRTDAAKTQASLGAATNPVKP